MCFINGWILIYSGIINVLKASWSLVFSFIDTLLCLRPFLIVIDGPAISCRVWPGTKSVGSYSCITGAQTTITAALRTREIDRGEVFRTFYRWSKGSEYILDLKRIMSGSVSLPLRLTKSPPPSMTRTWRRLRRQRDIPDTGDADSVIFRLPHSSSSFLSIMDREWVHDFRRCWPLTILMSTKSTAKINYSWFE